METQQTTTPSAEVAASEATVISFGTLLRTACNAATKQLASYSWFILMLLLTLGVSAGLFFGALFYLIDASAAGVELPVSTFIITGIVGLVWYTVAATLMVIFGAAYLYSLLHRTVNIGFWASVRVVLGMFWSLLWIAILINLVVNAGMLLLVIPGIAVSVYTMFAAAVLLTEQSRGLDALVRSTVLVKGVWWKVFWRLLGAVVLLYLAVGVLVALGLGLTAAIATMVPALKLSVIVLFGIAAGLLGLYVFNAFMHLFVLLFESLVARTPQATFNPAAHPRIRRVYFWFAIVGIPATIILSALDSDTGMSEGPDTIYSESFYEDVFEEMPEGDIEYGFIE